MAKFRRKPTRAETARANGARSRGPATPEGKARSRLNGLAHGLRARSLAPVTALGETPELVAADVAAYRREFPVPGPCARDLAAARPRAARADRLEAELLAGLAEGGRSVGRSFHDDPDTRADRLEAELLAGLAEGGRSVGRAFHDDPDTRAAPALVQRYPPEAALAASRARRALGGPAPPPAAPAASWRRSPAPAPPACSRTRRRPRRPRPTSTRPSRGTARANPGSRGSSPCSGSGPPRRPPATTRAGRTNRSRRPTARACWRATATSWVTAATRRPGTGSCARRRSGRRCGRPRRRSAAPGPRAATRRASTPRPRTRWPRDGGVVLSSPPRLERGVSGREGAAALPAPDGPVKP